jgi:hypothetical protein
LLLARAPLRRNADHRRAQGLELVGRRGELMRLDVQPGVKRSGCYK